MRCGGGELTRTVYREGHFSGVTSVVPLLVLIDRGTFSSTSAVACLPARLLGAHTVRPAGKCPFGRQCR